MGLDMYLSAKRYVSGYEFAPAIERERYANLVMSMGASAFVVIADSLLEQPGALLGFTEARQQNPNGNFTWGQVDKAQ